MSKQSSRTKNQSPNDAENSRSAGLQRYGDGLEIPAVNQVLASPGRPLAINMRHLMESSFGQDRNRVRLRASSNSIAKSSLVVNQTGDQYEREAERIAASVVGTKHPSTSPPQADLQQSRVDFSRVRIHSDSRASESAHSLNSHAYTVGQHIVFANPFNADSPRHRHLLAHELTHVVQQSGQSGGHSSVLQRYTAFEASEQAAGASMGWKHPASAKLRVSDDGQMVVEDRGWGAGLTKRAWTTPALIAESNQVLEKQESKARLEKISGGTRVTGRAPEGTSTFILDEIKPVNAKKEKSGGVLGGVLGMLGGGAIGAGLGHLAAVLLSLTGLGLIPAIVGGILGAIGGAILGSAIDSEEKEFSLAPDCGTACRQVMGSGTTDVAVINKPQAAGTSEEYLTPHTYHGGNPTTPEEWSEELFREKFGASSRAGAYGAYKAQSSTEKEDFDRKQGINKYAVPKVGQGLTVSTEKDMPGFTSSGFTWNFHYAATVLRSGHDYVTLENAAGWSPTSWIFFMYGPESKRQSFHEFQGATGTHGSDWTTFVVQPSKTLDVETNADSVTLQTGATTIALSKGTKLRIIESRIDPSGTELHQVEVKSGPHAGAIGTVRKAEVK